MPEQQIELGASSAPTSPISPVALVRVYKTQADAVAYLKAAGYKISTTAFNRAVKARKVPTNAEGHFEEPALLGYANGNLTPQGQAADKGLSMAATSRLTADTELKTFQAARQKLKLEKEQGLLMPRAEHERDLAARALFFKNEVRNFIHLYGAEIIHSTEGNDALLQKLVNWWEEKTAVWMDAWAREREFLLDEAEVEAETEED